MTLSDLECYLRASWASCLSWLRKTLVDGDHTLDTSQSEWQLHTSNVAGRHRGPKQKLQAGYRARHDIGMLCIVTHIFAYWTSPVSVTHVIFFIVECGIMHFLCTMCVFDVRASSSPRLPLCQISFLLCPPLLS